jgi:hypothetical protein
MSHMRLPCFEGRDETLILGVATRYKMEVNCLGGVASTG